MPNPRHTVRPKRPGEWLVAVDAADFLGIHNNTLKRIPASEIPYYRLNSRGDRRYQKSDLRAYIERRMVRS